ncbi:MAG: Crp/Fnr family transcriptional regulator [Dehalococcoidia bacterium]|nr:Crp/Fnr family transcriptional regulator [Dehalococcoidia bacterium]
MFTDLGPDDLIALASRVDKESYRKGEIIFERDEAASTLYIITTGQVKISSPSPAGHEAVLALLADGEFFGELSLFDEKPHSATAQAMSNTSLLTLHRDDFLAFVRRQPEVAIKIFRVLSSRLRQTNEVLQDAAFLDIPSRLAKRLLELAESHGVRTPEGILIDLTLTQEEIAGMVGATRESVNKALRLYIDKGLISREKQRITIFQPLELRKRIYY